MYTDRVPLLIAFTPSYLVPAATMLSSVLASSSARYEVVCMLSEPLSDADKSLLSLVDRGEGRLSFRYLEMKGTLEGAFVNPKYSEAANYRLIVADYLPEWDKAIYLDCDIIVRQDLGKLYADTDLEGYHIAGVVEASTEAQIKRFEHLGCEAGQYINSGFLLLNLKALRAEGVSARFVEALRVPYLEFPDQDVLNIVCRGRILHLSPLYNGIRTFVLPINRSIFERYYPHVAWERIQQEANLHYTGEKPWRAYTLFFEHWWQVYWRLPKPIRRRMPANYSLEWLARLFSIPGVRPIAELLIKQTRKYRR